MKNVILAFALVLGISMSSMAQNAAKKDMKENPKMELKTHTCTKACETAGHCVYVHGEKGHVCTAECKKMTKTSAQTEMKEHVCTAACKNGQHQFAHGEKGHVCTEACKMKM